MVVNGKGVRVLKTMAIVGGLLMVLSGCQSKEVKLIEAEKKEFNIVYGYEEDKLRPIVEKEKTVEELVEEIVLDSLGLSTGQDTYKEYGVLRGQGVFVESAIREGAGIPQVSAVPLENRGKEPEDNTELVDRLQMEEYLRLEAQRKGILHKQYQQDEDDIKAIVSELEKKVAQQEKGQSTVEDTEKHEWMQKGSKSDRDAKLKQLRKEAEEELKIERKKKEANEAERLAAEKKIEDKKTEENQ